MTGRTQQAQSTGKSRLFLYEGWHDTALPTRVKSCRKSARSSSYMTNNNQSCSGPEDLSLTNCMYSVFSLHGYCDSNRCAIATSDAPHLFLRKWSVMITRPQELMCLCLLRHNSGSTQRLSCFLPTDMLI